MDFITEHDLHLTITPCNNSMLFEQLSKMTLVKPKMPKFYLAQRDIYIDHPDKPQYKEAMELYEIDKAAKSLDAALLISVPIVDEYITAQRKLVKYRLRPAVEHVMWLDWIYTNLTSTDITTIVDEGFLTENRIYVFFNMLVSSVYRGGVEIINARLKNAINSQIELDNIIVGNMQLVHPLDEYSACVDSNISWIEWQEFDNHKKAEIIALYRIKRIVENHSQDEQQIEMEKRSKNS